MPSIKSILRGEQYSTIFKDTRDLAKVTADMVDAALSGKDRRGQRHQDLQQRPQGGAVLSAEAGLGGQEQLGEAADRQRLLQEVAVLVEARRQATAPSCLSPPGEAKLREAGRDREASPRSSTMNAILEMRGISKRFTGVKALSDVNFSVEPGEIHALVGENGAGKSTLMKVLSGVYPHGSYDGAIVFEGEERQLQRHHRFRSARHHHHPSGAGADPAAVDRREHLSRQSAGAVRRHRPRPRRPPHQGTAGDGRPARDRRTRWSPISASASSNWWRSPRRCRRRCGC